jgi:hypothetical protein
LVRFVWEKGHRKEKQWQALATQQKKALSKKERANALEQSRNVAEEVRLACSHAEYLTGLVTSWWGKVNVKEEQWDVLATKQQDALGKR